MKISRRETFGAIAGGAALPVRLLPARAHDGSHSVRLVVLDVGGTIIEDRGDVPEALRSAFANHGIAIGAKEIAGWRGASKREIVRHFVELRTKAAGEDREQLIAAVYGDFRAQVIEAYKTARPIDGAEDAIRAMKKNGLLLATTTGFDRDITTSIFNRLRWTDYFAATITSDDVAEGRPAPFMIFHAMESARVLSVSGVVTVGDTPFDLQAGTNAGVGGVVGVLSGASTLETLQRERHTHILKSVAGLPALLRNRL